MNDKSITQFVKIKASNVSLAARKLVHGVGVNDAWYMPHIEVNGKRFRSKAYVNWAAMIRRIYDPIFHKSRQTYIGATIEKDWLYFSNFEKWHDKNYKEGFVLDKDIKVINNKHYGPDTCLYIPVRINTLLINCESSRGVYPIGCCYCKFTGRYIAQIKIDGKNKKIGRFDTPEDAQSAYKKAKNIEILRKCEEFPEFAVFLKQHIYDIKD